MKKKNKESTPVAFIKNNQIVYLLLLVIVPSVLYFRVVNFDYSGLDDGTIIWNINNVQGSPLNLKEALTHDAVMGKKGDSFYRPMQIISLMVDAQIGGIHPWIYHLSNLILHILTVLVLFFFLKKTGIKKEISFLLALFFAIHPLLTNAAAWIPARGDILLCLFSLLSFITFLEYFDNKKNIYLLLHGIVFLLAVFSKETAVLLPIIILSYFYFVQKNKFILKDIIPFLILWFIFFVVFFLLRQSVLKISHSSNIFGIVPFIKNLPVITITFCKFFIPYNLSTMPMFDKTGIIGGGTLLVVLAALTFKFIRSEWKIVIWGIVWFLAFTIPPMFFRLYFATNAYEYFEFRSYLPVIGVLVIAGFLINELSANISFRKMLMISIPILLIYSMIAFIRLADFSDPVSFFTSAIKTNSNNAMAMGERGTAYSNKGRIDKAMSDYDNSIRVCPSYPMAYFNKGVILRSTNDHYKAEYFFSQALKYDTLNKDVYMLKASVYINLSLEKNILYKFDETKTLLKKAIRIYPENAYLHNNLGLAYYSTTKFDSALFEYNRAIESEKNMYTYYNNRGMAEYHLNNITGALNDFNRTLELKPDFLDAWGNRGLAKIKMKDYEGAVSDLTKAISIKKDIGAVWYYRGLAYSKLNKQVEADADWAEAGKLGFREPAGEK
jgi:tetratricopeptide (TPR) repeat protein